MMNPGILPINKVKNKKSKTNLKKTELKKEN